MTVNKRLAAHRIFCKKGIFPDGIGSNLQTKRCTAAEGIQPGALFFSMPGLCPFPEATISWASTI